MKKFKHTVTLLTAAVLFFLLPRAGCLRAAAAEPVTYAVKYIEENDDWRYLANTSTFDENAYHRELYYMLLDIKDGDIVIVYNETDQARTLDLGDVHLGNLTVAPSDAITMIFSGDVNECHILKGAYCTINANVANAHVYESAVCNFNKNVQELRLHVESELSTSLSVGCEGTVGHLYAPSDTLPRTFYDLYDFKAGKMVILEGVLMANSADYSSAPAQPPAPTAVPAPSAPATDNDEYDEVPKTGAPSPLLWLAGIAVVSAAISFRLRKSNESFSQKAPF